MLWNRDLMWNAMVPDLIFLQKWINRKIVNWRSMDLKKNFFLISLSFFDKLIILNIELTSLLKNFIIEKLTHLTDLVHQNRISSSWIGLFPANKELISSSTLSPLANPLIIKITIISKDNKTRSNLQQSMTTSCKLLVSVALKLKKVATISFYFYLHNWKYF